MADPAKVIRIFISSPGDVTDERDKARRVVDSLQRRYPSVQLLPLLWEELALPATASFQESIDCILGQRPIDIAVFIVWSRLGSPLGAANRRPDGTPYRSGTEREFDLMLAAFEQSGRQRPVILAYARDDDAGFRQALTESPADRFEEMISQRRLVEDFIREQFYDAEGRNLRAVRSYREPVTFAEQLHMHLRQVLDDLTKADLKEVWPGEPYRGLRAFDIEHLAIFRGREEETAELLQRLRDQQQAGHAFVVIVGSSGSGKSSLARAGVAASLLEHSFDDRVREWKIMTLVPGLCGGELFASLAQGLAQVIPELTTVERWQELLAEGLKSQPELTIKLSIAPTLSARDSAKGGATRVLLLVDQLEELWTDPRITAATRDQFFAALEALAKSPPFAVLATLRSDFYPQAQLSPVFVRMKAERGHFDLLPPGPSSLQKLIVDPARLAGLRFERDDRSGRALDELLLEAATRDPASLPLLQYTLWELYTQRDQDNHMLTLAAYDALGGVDGAIGKRAAETYRALSVNAKAALPEILPQLVTIDTSGEQVPVRRRAPLSELQATPARSELTAALITARFLAADRQGEFVFASLTHESLLRRWQQLADWVADNRDHLRMRAAVEQSQERWEQRQRHASLLLTPGLPLEEGRRLLRLAPGILSTATKDFIQTSITRDEARVKSRRQLRRATLLAMSILTIFALGGGAFAVQQWSISRAANEKLLKNNEELSSAKLSLTQTNSNLESAKKGLTQALERAERETSVARREQVRQLTARAWRQFDDGDPEGCFTLLGQALRIAAGDPAEEPLARSRFSHMWRRFPILGFWNDARAAAFSPNGQEFALGESTGSISIWKSDGTRLRKTLGGLPGAVIHIAYSPDGSQLATAGQDGQIVIWDTARGEQLRELRVPPPRPAIPAVTEDESDSDDPNNEFSPNIQQVWFTPDGLVGATNEGTVFKFGATGTDPLLVPSLVGRFIEFSADRTLVLTHGRENEVQAFDVATWKPVGTPQKHTSLVVKPRISPDGKLLAIVDGTDLRVVPIRFDGTNPPLTHSSDITYLGFSPDSTRIVTVCSKPFHSRALPPPPPGADVPIGASEPTHDTDANSEIRVIHIGGNASSVRLESPCAVFSAAFSPNGRELMTIELEPWSQRPGSPVEPRDRPLLRTWDAGTGTPIGAPVPVLSANTQLRFGAQGHLLATATDSYSATTLWSLDDLVTPGYLSLPTADLEYRGSTFSDATDVYTVLGTKEQLRWSLNSNSIQRVRPEPLEGMEVEVFTMVFELRTATSQLLTDSGQLVTIERQFTNARPVIETRLLYTTPALRDRMKARYEQQFPSSEDIQRINIPGRFGFVGFLRSTFALTNSGEQGARVWDINAESAVTPPMSGPAPVWRGTFSPDGRFVAVVFGQQAPVPAPVPAAQRPAVGAEQIAACGEQAEPQVVNGDSGLASQTVRIWDVRNGQPVTLIMPHPADSEEFSDDGRYFVAIGPREIRVWDLLWSSRCPALAQAVSLTQVVSERRPDAAGELVPWDFELVEAELAAAREQQIRESNDGPLDQHREEALWCADHAWSRRYPNLRIIAGKHAQVWVRHEPSQANAWLISASALAEQQQYAAARSHFETSLRLDPEEFDAWLGTALMHLRQGNTPQYVELCRQAYAKFQANPQVDLVDDLVWLHTLAVGSHTDADALNRKADWLCEQHPRERVHQNTKLAVLFRTRPASEVVLYRGARSATEVPGHELGADVLYHWAAVRAASNDEERAAAKRNLADIATRLKLSGKAGEWFKWYERVEAEILLRESQAEIGDFGPGSRFVPQYDYPAAPEAPPAPPYDVDVPPAPPAPAPG